MRNIIKKVYVLRVSRVDPYIYLLIVNLMLFIFNTINKQIAIKESLPAYSLVKIHFTSWLS